jgi:hypothetical protein
MILSEADEKLLQEQARLEKLKGPVGKGNYQPLPQTEEEIAWREAQHKREEAAKRPAPLPPRPEVDFLEQRRQQLTMERRVELLKGPIKRQGAS